jgi:hypothetical protein
MALVFLGIGLVALVVLGHVATDRINARRDAEFYEELVKARANLRADE